jgi:N-acyl-D-amino-acid deacylase
VTHDLVIAGGMLVDGTGSLPRPACIGVNGDTIAYVGEERVRGKRAVDATGLVVAPGFIDIHGHSDFTLLVDPRAASKLTQGVTTEVVGNCGGWAAPLTGAARERARRMCARYGAEAIINWTSLAEYLEELGRCRPAVNVGVLLGHGTLRSAVLGDDDRPPSSAELETMAGVVDESMARGALGLSTGLYYAPGCYAATWELVELCRVVARHGGVHACHLRDEDSYSIGLLAALDEVLDIAASSGVRTQVSHLKALGPGVWGQGMQLVEAMGQARARGLDVAADQYPYEATGSSITGSLIPRWMEAGGREALLARIKDPHQLPRVLAGIRENLSRRGGADRLLIAGYHPHPAHEGKTLAQVAASLGCAPEEAACQLLLQADASLCTHVLHPEDVEAIMPADFVAVASDGYALAADGPLAGGFPHPRSFGTFPRVLGQYVRERRLLTLEEAVRKMTSWPASRMGLSGRGVVTAGARADLVVFDPATVRDLADFAQPARYAQGILWVLVNGEVALERGELTAARAGRVLKRSIL